MINWNDIETKGRTSGTIKVTCPVCSETRKKKKDPCLSVNIDKGLAKCWHCDEISIRDFKEPIKKYDLPDQQWRNYTKLSDNTVEWFASRGITQKTLIETKITEEKHYQPAKQKEMNNIVFNYFEGNKLVNKKYRSGGKDFTQCKNAKKIFYGINDIIGEKEAYIVEGECFPGETEILTESGWICFDDYKGQKVLQVNQDKTSEFIEPNAIIKKHYNDDLILLKNKRGYSSISTKGHNYVIESRKSIKKISANEIYNNKNISANIPRVLNGINNEGLNISDDMLRFTVMISADFTIRKGGDYYAGIKKERKISRFKKICKSLNVRYSCNSVKNDYYSLFIHRGQGLDIKKLFPMDWIGKLSLHQMNIILDEILFWDGNSVPNRNQIEYSTKEIHNATFIQTLSHICGYCSTIIPRENKYGKWFKVSILFSKKSSSTQKSLKRTKKPYSGNVYCVNVNSGMILTRYNRCITIIGNCDKLAMYEIGIKNCISVPNGAKDSSDYFENCESYLKDIKKFYIAVDMDASGRELEASLIKRLGKHRCVRVHFKNKDANEDLSESLLVLEESLKRITEYPIDGTYTAIDIFDDIISLYENGHEQVIKPKNNFKRLNEVFGIIPGQLITVTGVPSHGKSNWIEWYVLNMVNDLDKKASFYSPEHFPMQLHQSMLCEKVTGKPFFGDYGGIKRITKDQIKEFGEWSKNKIYLTVPEKAEIPNWDWLFLKFEEQLYRYGIDFFVIDAWNKVKLMRGDLFEMNEVLARLTLFCQMHNVNIFLIAHPTKMRKDEKEGIYQIPTLYDVKGTGDFYDQTHCGLTVYRYFGEDDYTKVIPTKLKFKHQGTIGEEILFRYNKANGRYYEYNEYSNNTSFINEKQPEIVYEGFDQQAGF